MKNTRLVVETSNREFGPSSATLSRSRYNRTLLYVLRRKLRLKKASGICSHSMLDGFSRFQRALQVKLSASGGGLDMRLSDEDVAVLLDKFVVADKSGWRQRRLDDHKKWKNWVDPAKVGTIPDQDLKSSFLEYFNRGAGRYSFNAIYRDRIIRDLKEFRETLRFLLDEKIPVEKRLNDLLDKKGEHHIEGLGRGLATSFLTDLDPLRYPTWNNKTEMGLTTLGCMPEFSKADQPGARYLRILHEITRIRELRPELNFLEIDHFLHIVSAESDGIAAVEMLQRGGAIETPGAPEPLAVEMEFVMERYLEEFMEANFSKINFGAKLELYNEDEESTGRQYPTSIGPIDLLAVDRDRKEFVVIELKKGKTGDVVVGQVLRYMGWVNENLVPTHPGYGVRGIVVVSEEDDKLKYALSQIASVSGFTYAVSFDMKSISTKLAAAKRVA